MFVDDGGHVLIMPGSTESCQSKCFVKLLQKPKPEQFMLGVTFKHLNQFAWKTFITW